jgi:phospholipid transport system substrate-binding protein
MSRVAAGANFREVAHEPLGHNEEVGPARTRAIAMAISMTRKFAILGCSALVLAGADSARAADTDPAATQVQTLTASLLKSMQAGSALPMTERYRDLEPVIEQVFALPLVTRLSVGPEWANFTPDQQQALIAAFSRYTVANYAHNFRNFNGQKFEIDDAVVSRGQDKIVRTRIVHRPDPPVSMFYRMHEVDGTWKIIDVDTEGVSALALHRTDFAAAIASGGAPLLITHLNKASEGLMK